MTEQKIFVNEDGNAVMTCPECQTAKMVDVSRFKNIEKAVRLKVRCPNGHAYRVVLERRVHFRKQVTLPGIFTLPNQKTRAPMTVQDISRTGLNFKLSAPAALAEGDKIRVEFRLDDDHRTLIQKDVVVRTVHGINIGAQFYSIDPANVYDKALGFYMM